MLECTPLNELEMSTILLHWCCGNGCGHKMAKDKKKEARKAKELFIIQRPKESNKTILRPLKKLCSLQWM